MSAFKPWQLAIGYILVGMILAGGIFLVSKPPRGSAVILTPVATQEILIQVQGEVNHPGVYSLVPGSRVQDAIQAAGGLIDAGAADSLNMVRPLKDGEKINILPESQPALLDTAGSPTLLLDINLATFDDLDSLPGIGEIRAQAILDYRSESGDFITVEELKNVPGITTDVYEKIKGLVIVR